MTNCPGDVRRRRRVLDNLRIWLAFPFQPIIEEVGGQRSTCLGACATSLSMPFRHNLGESTAYTGQAINEGMAQVLPGTQTEQMRTLRSLLFLLITSSIFFSSSSDAPGFSD